MTSPHRKRKRGVILTTQGFRKLQAARSEAEVRANAGQRYTLEDLSERTGLSVDTVMKVLACEVGVDRQTLKNFFQAFRLPLKQSDFTHPGLTQEAAIVETSQSLVGADCHVLSESLFYVKREPLETICAETLRQPGALLRIKGAPSDGQNLLNDLDVVPDGSRRI